VVSLGAVLFGRFKEARALILGNPAHVERQLREDELPLVARRTRADVPEDIAGAQLPADLLPLIGKLGRASLQNRDAKGLE
jgi:hypothetical protein